MNDSPLPPGHHLRIAFVVNAFPVLSETFIFNKIRAFVERGHDVFVFAGANRAHSQFYENRSAWTAKVTIDRNGVDRRAPMRSIFAAVLHVLRAPRVAFALFRRARRCYSPARAFRAWVRALPFETRRLDIVHFEFSGLAVVYEDVLPLLSCPVVVSCRGTAEQVTPLVDQVRRAALARVFDRATRVHCVSENMVRTATRWGLDPARAFVNRPAIDPRDFTRRSTPAPSETLRLVSVGRVHWDKGFVYALIAVAQAHAQGIAVHYTIVGDGPDRTHLVYTADSLGIASIVRFAGALPSLEVRATLEASDVFLLPTVREGISNACIEAMALGMPVVSTTTGGMAELVQDGMSGVLVPPRDPGAMAAAIVRLFHSPAERAALARGAQLRVTEAFTIERQIAVFEREYQAMVESAQRSRRGR